MNKDTSSSVVGQVGVAPLPTFAGQSGPGYSNIGGWNLYINPHSKNLGLDLTFIKWMAGTRAQDILGKTYSEIPTNQAVRQSLATLATSPPPLKIATQNRLVPRPAGTPNYPAVSTAIYTNINAALDGSVSVSAGLASAQSQINSALGGGL